LCTKCYKHEFGKLKSKKKDLDSQITINGLENQINSGLNYIKELEKKNVNNKKEMEALKDQRILLLVLGYISINEKFFLTLLNQMEESIGKT
jgi:hypothetical protein